MIKLSRHPHHQSLPDSSENIITWLFRLRRSPPSTLLGTCSAPVHQSKHITHLTMCYFKLHICPYPHQDPVSALIFDPLKAGQWERCDKPQPWGRLSCGDLVVEHPKDLTNSETALSHEHILATRSNIPVERQKFKHMAFPTRQRRSSTDPIVPIGAGEVRLQGAPCLWCTAVLKMVATKSKEIQKEAHREIVDLEHTMDSNPELRKMRKDITEKEKRLDDLRHDAWRIARVFAGRGAWGGREQNAGLTFISQTCGLDCM